MDRDLFDGLLSNANSMGEDFNDGDEWPGWLTADWNSDGDLVITYEDQDNQITQKKYRVTEVVG